MTKADRALETTADRERALAEVRQAAAAWREGPLAERATQVVFGVGPATAGVMLLGEAPGYQEDQRGEPFVGPAGRLLDEGLAQAGLSRNQVYLTNVVKHRSWQPSGPKGRNRAPTHREVDLYRPWLDQELAIHCSLAGEPVARDVPGVSCGRRLGGVRRWGGGQGRALRDGIARLPQRAGESSHGIPHWRVHAIPPPGAAQRPPYGTAGRLPRREWARWAWAVAKRR